MPTDIDPLTDAEREELRRLLTFEPRDGYDSRGQGLIARIYIGRLLADSERLARVTAERDDLLKDAAVEWRCVECGEVMTPWQHTEARAEIAQLRARAETAERALVEAREAIRALAPDCGDNSCRFAPRPIRGVRTNGGCRCIEVSGMPPDKRRRVVATIKAALASPDAGKGSL